MAGREHIPHATARKLWVKTINQLILVKKKPQQDPDMLPEYDFSNGVRGKYAESHATACNMDVAQHRKEEVTARAEEVRRGRVVLIPGAEALARLRRRYSRGAEIAHEDFVRAERGSRAVAAQAQGSVRLGRLDERAVRGRCFQGLRIGFRSARHGGRAGFVWRGGGTSCGGAAGLGKPV